jgi:hypothetical protein
MKLNPAPTTVLVTCRTHTFVFPAGSHPAIREEIQLEANRPVPIPAAALPFALSFSGIEALPAAEASPADSQAPTAPILKED